MSVFLGVAFFAVVLFVGFQRYLLGFLVQFLFASGTECGYQPVDEGSISLFSASARLPDFARYDPFALKREVIFLKSVDSQAVHDLESI